MGDARDFQTGIPGQLPDVMRSRLAFDRRIGRKNDLCDFTVLHALFESIQPELFGANTIQRREMSHQYEIQAAVAGILFDCEHVGRIFDNTKLCRITIVADTDAT